MHNWYTGESSEVDWKGISDAAYYIGTNLRKWGRVGVTDMKEKYGTARVYCTFGWYQLHSVTHPGHYYSQYPIWLWKLDCKYLSNLVRLLNSLIIPIQRRLYTYLYGRALRKWPHLRQEILLGADHPQLLTKYGLHYIRTSEQGYTIRLDWHPDNFSDRTPSESEVWEGDVEDQEEGPVRWIKRGTDE